MRIRFADDMPVAAVEVLTPDLDSVERVALRPGHAHEVDVPSEGSFLRVHLPSGRAVTLHHSGDLDYAISRADVEARSAMRTPKPRGRERPQDPRDAGGYKSRTAAHSRGAGRRAGRIPFGESSGTVAAPGPGALWGVATTWDAAVDGVLSRDGRELVFTPGPRRDPYRLEIRLRSQTLVLSLPGSLDATHVRVDHVGAGTRIVGVRVSTISDAADTLGAYLDRGDYYAAEAMAEWAEDAEQMLNQKMSNPYAAALGAYLLLRLERFERMHDWPRNLANWFDFLPDGCVIWAWQNILQQKNPQDVSTYLLEAVRRGMPVYTEGLRLLSDGLRLLGDEGAEALAGMSAEAGTVVWSSPFTARLFGSPGRDEPTTTFDIGYLPTV